MKRANMQSFLHYHVGRLHQELDALRRLVEDEKFSAACQAEIDILAGEIQADGELLENLMQRAGFLSAPSSPGMTEPVPPDAGSMLALRTLEDLVLGNRSRELMWRAMADIHFECHQWPDIHFEELAERSRRRAGDIEEKFLLIARSSLSWINGFS